MSNETVEGLSENIIGISFWQVVTAVSVLIGIIVGLITIRQYLRERNSYKTDIRDLFPFTVIKPDELQDNLATTVKGLHYVQRPKSITKASGNKIGTLIIGKPHAGKTREALEVVRRIRRDVTVLIPDSKASIEPFKVPNDIGSDVVLFLDDLPNYYANPKEFHESFKRTIKTLDDACNSVYVVTTARTTELDKLYEYPGNFWDYFEKIELVEFGNEETHNLIDELCKHFEITIDVDAKDQIVRENDRTPKNISIFFKKMNEKDIQRISREEVGDFKPTAKESWDVIYNKLSEDERLVFKALDVIHGCGVLPHRKFVSMLAKKIHRPKSIFGKRQIEKSVDGLIRKCLIEEKESLILCDDIYREGRGDVDENIKNLVKILFTALKDRKLKIFTYLSLTGFADVLSGREKFAEEIEVTRKIIELNPDLAAAHFNLGLLLNNQGRYDEAEEEYRGAIRADLDYAAAHHSLGVLLDDQGRYDEAEEEYRGAIRADPDYAAPHSNLGGLLGNQGRYDEAEEEYRGAIRADPDYAAAHSNLGILLNNQGRYNEAEEEWRETIRVDPDYAAAHSNLGGLLHDQGRYDEAEEEWRVAIRVDPDYAAAHSNLGILLNNQGRYNEAEEEYRDAIRADPDLAAAHSNLGVLLGNQGRYDEAEKEYRDAIRADLDDAAAHYNLGNLLRDRGRFDEAEAEYRNAIQAYPDYADAHGNLGSLFLITERPEEAKKEFEVAKELFKSQGRDEDVKKVEELLSHT
ncbi:MAG: tetratricopeptide repeat protein [Candidatus Methanospirareceae archaeon]